MDITLVIRNLPYVKYYLEVMPVLEYVLPFEDSPKGAIVREYLSYAYKEGVPLKEIASVMSIDYRLRNMPHSSSVYYTELKEMLERLGPSTLSQIVNKNKRNLERLRDVWASYRNDDIFPWAIHHIDEFYKLISDPSTYQYVSRRFTDLKITSRTPYSAIMKRINNWIAIDKEAERLRELERKAKEKQNKDIVDHLYSSSNSLTYPYNPSIRTTFEVQGKNFALLTTRDLYMQVGAVCDNCLGRFGYWENALSREGHALFCFETRELIWTDRLFSAPRELSRIRKEDAFTVLEMVRKTLLKDIEIEKELKKIEAENLKLQDKVIDKATTILERYVAEEARWYPEPTPTPSIRVNERPIRFDPFSWTGRR